jgi:hypothetical protein
MRQAVLCLPCSGPRPTAISHLGDIWVGMPNLAAKGVDAD